ncbi:MAG: hypothetical protein KME47_09500 [Nodosilinea sp. WJT8-NPBG4]|jgi:hypothetical protein|nr:hypothetical protein [Nodosilinea sp. WJT8-NPBG4]
MQDLVYRNLNFHWKSIYEITNLSGTIRPVTSIILSKLKLDGVVESKEVTGVTYWRRRVAGTPERNLNLIPQASAI